MNTPTLPLARSVAFLCGGLLVWAALYLFVQVFAALACARGLFYAIWFEIAIVPALLLAVTAAALAALWVVARRADKLQDGIARRNDDTRRVVAHVALEGCGLALIAIVWSAAPLLLVTNAC